MAISIADEHREDRPLEELITALAGPPVYDVYFRTPDDRISHFEIITPHEIHLHNGVIRFNDTEMAFRQVAVFMEDLRVIDRGDPSSILQLPDDFHHGCPI